jgi:hypothetical protein
MRFEMDKQIVSLNADSLAHLSIEELEARLEMQLLVFHFAPDDKCATFGCGTHGACPSNNCGTYSCASH